MRSSGGRNALTLAELLVSISVFSVISLMLVYFFVYSKGVFATGSAHLELTERCRFAMSRITPLLCSTVDPSGSNSAVTIFAPPSVVPVATGASGTLIRLATSEDWCHPNFPGGLGSGLSAVADPSTVRIRLYQIRPVTGLGVLPQWVLEKVSDDSSQPVSLSPMAENSATYGTARFLIRPSGGGTDQSGIYAVDFTEFGTGQGQMVRVAIGAQRKVRGYDGATKDYRFSIVSNVAIPYYAVK